MNYAVIHSDTISIVVQVCNLHALDVMGLKYTEIPANGKLHFLLADNQRLRDQLIYLLPDEESLKDYGL